MASVATSLGIVGGYLVVALAVGLLAYRVTERTAEDYYLASRGLGTLVLLFTTFATLLSAFTFFGGPNLAYAAGPEWILVMGLMDGILFAILWYVVGYKQWLVGRERGYVTLGEMLGDRFGSRGLRALVAGVSLFWLFPYVMLQQKGAGQALVGLTDGAVPFWVGAAGITLFMIVYVAAAGMRGIAWTDTLQGVFMLVMIWVALLAVLASVGGPAAATASVRESNPEFLALGGGLYSAQFVVATAVYVAFGVAMFPQINQRFFVARSEAVFKRTFSLWPVLVLLLFVPAFMLGTWAAGLGVTVPENGNVVPVVLRVFAPGWLAALVIAGALAAMMSSSDSMLLSGSSYLTRDLYRPFVEDSTREDLVARVGVVLFATGSFLASLEAPGTLVSIGNTAFGGFAQLALPVAVALYWTETTRDGMLAGVLASQAFYLGNLGLVVVGGRETMAAVGAAHYLGWHPGIPGMALGLLVTIGVSLVTTPAADENRKAYLAEAGAD